MAQSSSISLLQTMEFAKRFNFLRSSATGNYLEPALTSANTILQTIVGAPFSWRWNRTVTGFVTVIGQQDYTVFNYLPSTAVKLGWFTVDTLGNSQVCTTAGTTGASTPSWSNTVGATTSDGSVVWTNRGSLQNGQAKGQYTFAWTETASVLETTVNSGSVWKEMASKINLALEDQQARPRFISAQFDDGLGNITFRMSPVPDKAYPVVITMQQKPPLFTKTAQTWAPIPDEYSHIYNWGFLALMFFFADDPRFQIANSKFISSLLSTSEGLDQTQLNIFLNNWQAVSGAQTVKQAQITQGFQGRQNA